MRPPRVSTAYGVELNPFSPDYLFQSPTTPASTAYGILTAGFILLFLVSAVAYFRRSRLARENPVLRRLIRRVATVGMWSAGIGIFLALMRYAQVLYLSMPIFMDLLFLWMIGEVAYFVYDLSERYPLAVWRLQESHVERRYRPTARSRAEPQRPRPKIRGKGRR